MMLLISTCSQKLSEEEFVSPISKIITSIKRVYEIKHYKEKINFEKYEKIIICGTAMKDNEYLDDLEQFNWIKTSSKPILGICSGMQVIALQFGGKIIKKKEIGMINVKVIRENILFSEDFVGYALHGNGISNLIEFYLLAKSDKSVQAIKHKKKEIYGVMFHPEVRNEKLIEIFTEQSS